MLRSESGGRERSWRLSDGGDSGRYYIRVCSRDKAWVVRQSFEGFRNFDRQLHRCIYDRKFSLLPELEGNDVTTKSQQVSVSVLLVLFFVLIWVNGVEMQILVICIPAGKLSPIKNLGVIEAVEQG